LTFSGGNPGIIKAEIFNLQSQKEGSVSAIETLEKSIPKLFYRRAELITGLNIVSSQMKDKNLAEGIRKILIEKASFIKNELSNVQYQIDTTQERIRGLKSSEYSINILINSRKNVLNNLTGNIVAKRQSEGSFQTNKELGRIKG
jgi:hypothetical protein